MGSLRFPGWSRWVPALFPLTFSMAQAAQPVHGMAMRAEVKYKPDFRNFDYSNPDAPKGGTLTLASSGSFDTMNPYSVKGTTTAMIGYANIFETLTTPSLDEPFAQYGLLAKTMTLADDGLSITFSLHDNAKFSDGKPVTAADVVFSYELLTSEKSRPFYRMYYADIKRAVAENPTTVKFEFKKQNPELHLIIGQMPVLPKHFYGAKGKDFGSDFNSTILGSGPYVIQNFDFGKIVRVKRNPDYWGKDLAVNKGRFNFDAITLKYYKDENVMLEGMKAGDFDFAAINSSKQWATDVAGERWTKNWIVKRLLPHKQTQGMQGLVMNTRRPLFQNRDVRRALAVALDFDWMNETLFFKQYTPQSSYFDNSELKAPGLPSPGELKLLEPWRGKIPDEVFTQPLQPLGKGLDGRARLREAMQALQKAGWKIQDGKLVNAKNEPFRFKLLLSDPSWQRIAEPYLRSLGKLGIEASTDIKDDAIYVQRVKQFDYDMIVDNFGQSESPGNEQRDMWHSSSADVEDSRNTAGIRDPAVDALVETIIRANTRGDLLTAVHALDRVLWFNYFVVPNWYISAYRVTYWNRYSLPEKLPPYFGPVTYFVEHAWLDPAKSDALAKATKSGAALPKQ